MTTAALADDPTSMAPPVETSNGYAADSDTDYEQATGGDTVADSVFNWREIPANQRVPLARAAFDKGGYQLYDTVGETIVIPFTNQNLYVMKFAESDNGTMYFVNTGTVPILYVPRDGYLENAAVSGTRWYPLGEDFHPSEPVFLGIAPSWTEFVDLGWYPDECYYGGYWGHRSFIEGGIFLPTVGLFFEIGGGRYYGWHGYRDYVSYHPAPYRIGYFHRDYYRWADRPRTSLHPFGGDGNRYYAHQEFGGTRGHGDDHAFGENRGFDGNHNFASNRNFGENHDVGGGGRVFRGAGGYTAGGHGYTVNHDFSGGRPTLETHNGGGHTFRGGAGSGPGGRNLGGDHTSAGGHSDNNDHSFHGDDSNNTSVFNGSRANGDHTFTNERSGGDHTFNGGRSNDNVISNGSRANNAPVFSGGRDGDNHTFNGARGSDDHAQADTSTHDSGGGHSSSSAPDFHGGARPSSGDGGARGGGGGGPRGSRGDR